MACSDTEALLHHAGGNDLAALQRAHARCRAVASNPNLPWWDRERALELLSKGDLLSYEATRAEWVELHLALSSYNKVRCQQEHEDRSYLKCTTCDWAENWEDLPDDVRDESRESFSCPQCGSQVNWKDL